MIAAYNYEPRQEDELGFTKGSVINVLLKQDADWWKGEHKGKVGMFPANYVTTMTSVPADAPTSGHFNSCELNKIIWLRPDDCSFCGINQLISLTGRSIIDRPVNQSIIYFDRLQEREGQPPLNQLGYRQGGTINQSIH